MKSMAGPRIHYAFEFFIVFPLLILCPLGLLAAQETGEMLDRPLTEVMTAIGGLNRLARTDGFSHLPVVTNSARGKALSERSWELRAQLALQGVCVVYKNGSFAHATRESLNGYGLGANDARMLAELNYAEQYARGVAEVLRDYRPMGETGFRIRSLKQQLESHGISVKWNGALYIVQSVQTNSEAADHDSVLHPNFSPTNAPTSSSEQ